MVAAFLGLIRSSGAADKGKPLVKGENAQILAIMFLTTNNNPEKYGPREKTAWGAALGDAC